MKKILSILLAAMLAFSALGATSMMAFAASNTVASPEHTTRDNDKIGQVNGKVSDDVDYEVPPIPPRSALPTPATATSRIGSSRA